MRRLVVPLLALFVVAGACTGGDDGETAGTTTAAPSTTLRESRTPTTLGPRVPTEIDVCTLLNERELDTVLEDAGPGEITVTTPEVDPGEVPPLLTGQCAWPSASEPAFTLYYLAPTTAATGATHLRDVITLEPEFTEEAQVIETDAGNQQVGLLIDRDGKLREVAVVARSALLFLVVDADVDGRDTDATQAYADLIVRALIRAPR